ncbi:MAG: glycosyltransferase family 4 protein [Candidatus Kerfeldbacteria bacterium]|nr:glycosyltransferase family 4 protein [Candidatus Kerfeldbacteria bacterium]
MKRVAFIVDAWFPVYGGGQVYVWEIARRLVKRGWAVDIHTRALIDEGGKGWAQSEMHADGHLRVFRYRPTSQFGQPLVRLWFLFRVLVALLVRRADVLNPQSILPGLPSWLAGKLIRRPVVMTVHGTALFLPTSGLSLRQRFERRLERFVLTGLRYSREISVASNFVKLPNVNQPVVIIPNGVDVSRFDRLQVPKSDHPAVLFVGRFDWIKGIDVLLEAWPNVRSVIPAAELHLVGYGYEQDKLRDLAGRLKIEDSVHFLGKRLGDDLVRLFKSSHLFVLPSRSEGQPLTLLEAWAAKLPVVATDVGDNRALVERSEGGQVVSPENREELSAAIVQALQHPTEANQAYQLVKREYSWDVATERILQQYQAVSPS